MIATADATNPSNRNKKPLEDLGQTVVGGLGE
jgi:hypothetical protein